MSIVSQSVVFLVFPRVSSMAKLFLPIVCARIITRGGTLFYFLQLCEGPRSNSFPSHADNRFFIFEERFEVRPEYGVARRLPRLHPP